MSAVIVADDENLDIAHGFGFDTVVQSNDELGRKFNDGIEFACRQGADFVVLIGSDDWMHADLFDRLPADEGREPTFDEGVTAVTWGPGPEVITGRVLTLVNLAGGVLQRLHVRSHYGVIPWIFPRSALEPSGFRPIKESVNRGIDGSMIAGLGFSPNWVFTDPHDLCRVDFKSKVNLTPYRGLAKNLGYGAEETDPWSLLAEKYPATLVDQARELSARESANMAELTAKLRPIDEACEQAGIDLVVEYAAK